MISVYYTTERTESRAFLIKVLRERYGISAPELRTTANGKPYLAENRLYFNLSHSGKLIAAAVSEREIGLDIQLRDEAPRPAIFRRLTPAEKQEDFFKLWTAKEAYVKYKGGTLAAMLPALEYKAGTLYENGSPAPVSLFFTEVKDCAVCVCSAQADEIELILL